MLELLWRVVMIGAILQLPSARKESKLAARGDSIWMADTKQAFFSISVFPTSSAPSPLLRPIGCIFCTPSVRASAVGGVSLAFEVPAFPAMPAVPSSCLRHWR